MNTIVNAEINNPFTDELITVELPLFVTGFVREDGEKFINVNIAITFKGDGSSITQPSIGAPNTQMINNP